MPSSFLSSSSAFFFGFAGADPESPFFAAAFARPPLRAGRFFTLPLSLSAVAEVGFTSGTAGVGTTTGWLIGAMEGVGT